jgi:hypothetical protein
MKMKMNEFILDQYNRIKNETYTTLVIRSGHLQERYYPTFDKPDYTILKRNLNKEQLEYCKELGII